MLDFVGDVGGLQDGLLYIGKAILFVLSLFIQNPLTRHLISQIFVSDD